MGPGDEAAKTAAIERITQLNAELYRTIFSSNPRPWIDLDLTMAQLKVLFLLYMQGRHTMSALADRLGVRLPTVTGVLDRLVEHGLVKREADPDDRRVVWVRLNEAGESLVGELHAANLSTLAGILAGLSLADLAALERGLAALKRAYDDLGTYGRAPGPIYDRSVATAAAMPARNCGG